MVELSTSIFVNHKIKRALLIGASGEFGQPNYLHMAESRVNTVKEFWVRIGFDVTVYIHKQANKDSLDWYLKQREDEMLNM
jgi:hypothetical protein